ncbi:MAG: hypothetical protein WDO15_11375 [Bacteroidota bacterium]
MKKLINLTLLFLVIAMSVVTASPIPFLVTASAGVRSMLFGLSDVDVTAITSYAANNQAQLISSLINGLDIAQDIMVMPNVKNKIPMPKLTIGKGFRPYSGTQEFKSGGIKYADRFLEVKVGKRELQIDPEDFRGTYLAWLNSPGSGANKQDIPFAEYMWAQVIKQLAAEMNDETAYKGFDGSATADFNPASTYTAASAAKVRFASTTNNPNAIKDWWMCIADTSAAQTPDTHPAKWQNVTARAVAPGIESYILTEISGSNISPVATGAITGTSGVALTAFTKLYRAYQAAYKNNGIITSCSYTDYEFLLDDLLSVYAKYTKSDLSAMPFVVLPNTNGKGIVKPATWLGSSRRLIAGPSVPGDPNGRHLNLWMGTDQLSDANEIKVSTAELWKINGGIKAALGFNIQDVVGIKVGDQV